MKEKKIIIVGGGMGGLCAAIALAGRGLQVTLLEAAPTVGGKLREVDVGGAKIDGGPTVFTMRWVFDELFAEAGVEWPDTLTLDRANILARHAWSDGAQLDLFADIRQSADAIGEFSGKAEAQRFLRFAKNAGEIYRILESPFLRSSRPSLVKMMRSVGLGGLKTRPFSKLWNALGDHFTDPRLIQLFGRYATYCGCSPYLAPATLMLVAHVEMEGVWLVRGGMYRLAESLRATGERLGVTTRTNTAVTKIVTKGNAVVGVETAAGEHLSADAVLVNADASALAAGFFGPDVASVVDGVPPNNRSLSALAWTLVADVSGLDLLRHTVFFNRDYRREFTDIFDRSKLPSEPTVYVCAQDRGAQDQEADEPAKATGPERLLMIINAPPTGDRPTFDRLEIEQCQERSIEHLSRCGLNVTVDPAASLVTSPIEFDQLFPGSGGALYGMANHRTNASFNRPDSRTKFRGLYLAGGSVHPGPGVPMAALSGRLAAQAILNDFTSTGRSTRGVTLGGTSTR